MGIKDWANWGDSAQDGTRRPAGRVIQIYSVTHGWNITFFASLTNYDESYKVNYAKERVFGRMDPLCTYQNTERSLSFGLESMAHDFGDGLHLQQKLSYLAANLYPQYKAYAEGETTYASANAFHAPPYFRIMFGLMIQDGSTGIDTKTGDTIAFGPYGQYPHPSDAPTTSGRADDVATRGSTGIIEEFSFKPKLEIGMWDGTYAGGNGLEVVPKGYDISFSFTPLASVTPGWANRGADGSEPFSPFFPGGYSLCSWMKNNAPAAKRFHPADPPALTPKPAGSVPEPIGHGTPDGAMVTSVTTAEHDAALAETRETGTRRSGGRKCT